MKQLLSALLSTAMLLTGCAGGAAPTGTLSASSPEPALTGYSLATPAYPEFPTLPQPPEELEGFDWDAYSRAQADYYDAMRAFRGDGLQADTLDKLNAFAARSIPSALEGHEGENTIYSPLSLWAALAMLAPCANGNSRQQVLNALDVSDPSTLADQVSQVWHALYTEDGTNSLLLANSIWLNSAVEGSYVQDTLDTLAQKYFAGAYSVPMGTQQADQAITDWVKEQTHGLIGSDAPVVDTSAQVLALLASALYYRAGWTDAFQPDQTEKDIFTDASGAESKVDFMHQTQNAHFLREKGWQAASLSTSLGEMVFVLPDQGVTPESLLQDSDFLSQLDISGEKSQYGEVRWSVPKFDADSDVNLLGTLSALGITDLLHPDKADLFALTTLDAFLSDAKQLARVKVDEEGVEAAAVTLLILECTSAPLLQEPEVCVMDLDRPFLFVIRTQGVPLFVGVVNQVA
ncbi:MAG: serpin family protein [Lawsonibacter sp.]|nr:serpin family protein [Lawsonibacter sp.]